MFEELQDSLSRGWLLVRLSVRIFLAHPVFLVPIAAVWAIYAPMALYLKYSFPWRSFSIDMRLAIVFIVLFIFSFLLLFSCSVVLELIQQIETGRETSLSGALAETVSKNMNKILPIALIWAALWFILTVIRALIAALKKEGEGSREEFNMENAAKTLGGYGGEFSLIDAFIDVLIKGIRMIVFLILPAAAWEDLGFSAAIKRGLTVFRSHAAEFASGYALTYAAAIVVFFPSTMMFLLGTGRDGASPLFRFPDYVWTLVIIYIGFAWSFCMYLEQMFAGSLYLWHMKWEKSIASAQKQGQPMPKFDEIKPPSLLDDVPDLSV